MNRARFILKALVSLWAISLLLVTSASGADLTLKYSRPADLWTEALPVGNGRLGALVFGGVTNEYLQIDEDSLRSDAPRDWNNPGAQEILPQVRAAIFAGDYVKAGELCKKMPGPDNESHQLLAEWRLNFPGAAASVTDYERSLDFERAVATVRYRVGNATFTREVFSSYPDQVIVIRLTCDQPGQICFDAAIDGRLLHAVGSASTNTLVMSGSSRFTSPDTSTNPPALNLQLRALAEGGTVTCAGNTLAVTNASAVTLLLATAALPLELAQKKTYATLLVRHTADYQKLFHHVDLFLANAPDTSDFTAPGNFAHSAPSQFPLDQAALFYQYGRYLLIAGSHSDNDDTSTDFSSAGGLYANLFADRLAFTEAMTGMFLQSHFMPNPQSGAADIPVLDLLPDLPPAWPFGQVTGLPARGGFTVDMDWKTGRLVAATIRSTGGTIFEVRTGNYVKHYKLKRGRTIILDAGLEKWSE